MNRMSCRAIPIVRLRQASAAMIVAAVFAAATGIPSRATETRYSYDDLGRLVRVERPEGVVVKYTYDAVGNRLSRTIIHDLDFDDVADSVDNCPAIPNTDQADADGDLVGNVCDNCPAISNADQANDDGDAAGNLCDCLPNDGTAFNIPHEIQNVGLLPDKTTIEWNSDAANSGSGTIYDVMRGNLVELPVGSGVSETCLESGSIDASSEDLETPLPGSGFYYIVRGVNNCGTGTYGFASSNTERTSAACP